jgi:metal-sulfur cluster biosynthetic enzyme
MTPPAQVIDRTEQEQAVQDAIATVIDPCSIAAKVPISIIELGLVRGWTVANDGEVNVTVTPTAPSCILIGSIVRGIEERVGGVEGVRRVNVEIDAGTVWSPALMSSDARSRLKHRQDGSMAEVPVRPRQWESVKGA